MAWMRMMGADSVAYHRATVAGRADDHPGQALAYYAARGETPLVWGGTGADRLRLAGAVTDDAYERTFGPGGAVHRHENWRLVSTKRPGVELVVAAHKSVALLGVIGKAEDMHAILDVERDATLAYLDTWFHHRGGRRGRAQTRTPTHGLTWAVTRHSTSRAGDPAPHDHVLVANVVAMADERGGWKALDTAALRDILHAATAFGRLHSARKALELGYGIEPDDGPSGRLGHWRIAGIPDAACQVLSKRSDEIAEYLERLGQHGPRAAAVAARATRTVKRDQPPDELVPGWKAELTAAGFPPPELWRSVVDAAHRRSIPRPLGDREIAELADRVLGVESPLARRKVFTRSDLIVALAPALHGQDPAELRRVVGAVLASRGVLPLLAVDGARERAYCPAHVLATEHAIALAVDHLATTWAEPVDRRHTETALARKRLDLGAELSAGQETAVRAICGQRRVTVVEGVAGAGKTTALDAARHAHERAGWQVLGCATSGQAARTLATDAQMHARTIASLLWQIDRQRIRLDARTLVVLDEAGMTADADLERLLAAVDAAGAKAVLVGDPHQLGAVGPGGALDAVLARHPHTVVRLDENLRQHDPHERRALAQLRDGDTRLAVRWYARHQRIHTAPDRFQVLTAAVEACAQDVDAGHDSRLLAWRRRDVADLNRLARAHWRATGHLDGPEIEAGGRRWAAGDLVVVTAPDHEHGLVTSERATVERVDESSRLVLLRTAEGRLVPVDPAHGLDHAYATTIHRSQGATVDTAHVIADGGGRELAYVAMSRARQRTDIHTVADDLDQAVEQLGSDWSVSHRQRWITAAHELEAPAQEHQPHRPPTIAERLDALQRRQDPPTRGISLGR